MTTQALTQIESHYRVLREGAGLLDRSARGKIDVLGPDALEYIQGQVTNDVQGLAAGEGCYATLLSPKGRILADMWVLVRSAEELWLDTEAGTLEPLLSKLDMYRIGRRVELADRSEERALLSLIGPAARKALGTDLPETEHAFVQTELEGVPVVAAATDVGVDLLFDRGQLELVRAALTDRGAVPVPEEAAEILRIEGGRPRYGVDMTEDNLPGEVGVEQRAVSFTKGCYVGQEPVARMHYRGHPNRHLRGLQLSAPAKGGEPVFKEAKEIGKVTSTGLSPALGPIALALLRREVEPGETVRVGDAGPIAHVAELPFAGGARQRAGLG
jgi:tRNA-modifying protein YgfZ